MTKNKLIFRLVLGLLLLCAAAGSLHSKEKPLRAEIRVSGMGLIGDRATRVSLENLWGERLGAALSSDQLEDGVLFIASNLAQDGFQQPTIKIEAVLADGSKKTFSIDPTLQTPAPAGLQARSVKFAVHKGVRSYLRHVSISGIHVLKENEARDFFFSNVALFEGKEARAYSTGRLRRSADALQSTLRQKGYAESTVRIDHVEADPKSGAVSVQIKVDEGPRWILEKITTEVRGPEAKELEKIRLRKGIPWSTFRAQDLNEEIRRMYFKNGYADVRVNIQAHPGTEQNGERPVEVVANIQAGGQVAIGEVKFTGEKRVRESVLKSRVELKDGELLNPVEIEKARYRLARLGIFESVDLKYEPPTGPVRDPVFVLDEDKPIETNLLMGYGSYEKLRGGVEVLQKDLFGLAHQSRLELVQSFKSSKADYTYSVPEIFGDTVDGSVRLFGLRRQEVAFLREEYGATVTLKRKLPSIGADGTLSYTYQSLLNPENDLYTSAIDQKQVIVGSLSLGLTKEARDNPLRPRRGYRWFLQSEFASQELGSQVNYQRIEMGADYHTSWGRGRWIHAALSHGFVTTLGSNDELLPVDRRFYPGGDESIRGYPEGEATPRGPDGRYLGAKSYVLANFEVEQALTNSWTVVVFTDGLGITGKLSSYPFDTEMVSVGLGVRYYTLIGPVRLEYGQNVKRRTGDPSGALHLSVGFPF